VETAYRAQGSLLRKEYGAVVELNGSHDADHTDLSLTDDDVPGGPLRRGAIVVARQRAFEPRRDDVIGDDAYWVLVQELGPNSAPAAGAWRKATLLGPRHRAFRPCRGVEKFRLTWPVPSQARPLVTRVPQPAALAHKKGCSTEEACYIHPQFDPQHRGAKTVSSLAFS
jgi:hypothetical protein